MMYGNHGDYRLTQWVFVRGLALVYTIAFLSLGVQILGLVGSGGILPVSEFLSQISANLDATKFWRFPTLCWLNSGDTFLIFLSYGGAALSILVILGLLQGPLLLVLWAFYLSLTVAGQTFLYFQWDLLLLEVGFVSIFFAPWRPWSPWPSQSNPSRPLLWLLRFVLFKLLFMSGAVKLLSGDPVWRDLSALTYHYWTQPLPNIVSWYVHQLPVWFHQFSAVLMFAIELIAPFFIFCPRPLRLAGFGLTVSLQFLIILTGNYGFFNILTLVLCVVLLDDKLLKRWIPVKILLSSGDNPVRVKKLGVTSVMGVLLLILFVSVSLVQSLGRISRDDPWTPRLRQLIQFVAPFRSINRYGLFAMMTTERREILIEGSRDGQEWLAYEFNWKPGDLKTAPRWSQPHMPRLDWQMWFAALGNMRGNPWLYLFMERLLEGAPEVVDLIAHNPFPNAPPPFVRAQLYDYHFTNREEKAQSGHWWRRELIGPYSPTLQGPSFRP